MFVTSRLYARVEKFRRVDCARIVGGAKSWVPAMISAPERLLALLQAGHRLLHEAQPRRRGSATSTGSGTISWVMRLPSAAVLVAAARRHGDAARSSTPSVRIARPCIQRAQRARGDGQDDVVDRAAERVLDALEVVEPRVDEADAPVRADLDVERRVRRGAQHRSARPRRRPAPPGAAACGRRSSRARAPARRHVAHAPAQRGRRELGRGRLGVGEPGVRRAVIARRRDRRRTARS